MSTSWTWTSSSPAATRALGQWLGQHATPGLVIALEGELGAGKTALVQALARGLGVPADVPVTSPTFSLVNPYEGRLRLYHLDLYRLGDMEELEVLGFRDLLGGDAVTAVEWADRFPEVFPRSYLRVRLEHVGPRSRRLRFDAMGEGPASELLRRLVATYASGRSSPGT